jgi:hypothetical protein
MATDPRSQVEAPIRGALAGVMGRGVALVGAMALLALWSVVARPVPEVGVALAYGGPALLLGYALWVRAGMRIRGTADERDRRLAWVRAKRIDPADAALGRMVATWVPVGLLLTLGVLLWPQLTNPDWDVAEAWIVLGLPPYALAWLVAATTWLDACRDDLARAQQEADRRLRGYWSNAGR